MKFRVSITGACLLALGACASGTYNAPSAPVVQTTKLANGSADALWDAVVSQAPALGYEIRESDRQAGTIRLAFNPDNPKQFVDCGTYVGSTGQTSFSGQWITWVTNSRKARLTGLMDVTLAPVSEDQTQVAVRAGYALTLPASIAPGFAGADFSFASDSSDTVSILDAVDRGDKARTCGPSGFAEQQILDLV